MGREQRSRKKKVTIKACFNTAHCKSCCFSLMSCGPSSLGIYDMSGLWFTLGGGLTGNLPLSPRDRSRGRDSRDLMKPGGMTWKDTEKLSRFEKEGLPGHAQSLYSGCKF